MPDTSRAVLLAGAWLLTYLIHSSALLGGTVVLQRVMGKHFERVAETTWRVAMAGAVLTTSAQLAWLGSARILLVLGANPQAWVASPTEWISQWAMSGAVDDVVPMLLPALLSVWSIVALIRLAMLARAERSLARLIADRVPLRDERLAARLRILGGTTAVRVSVSRRILTPMVVGRRELCLPERALQELSPAELDAVLAHEIAHIARHDRAWLSLGALVERVLFLQPLNALAAMRLRALAECACDDWALRHIADPLALAGALARVTEWMAGSTPEVHAISMASRESLTLVRVRRMLDPLTLRHSEERRPLRMLLAGGVLTAMILFAPGVSANHGGARSLVIGAPATRYTIQANDDGGRFVLTLDGDRATALTIDGVSVDPRRMQQSGNRLRVTNEGGDPMLELTLTGSGGIQWTSRPKARIALR